ncbi:hypothetical protein DEQ92_10325 [Haloferax sp. Atlit-6N]|uniref:hypothetical protein n=2 Tax=Haloferacaceae TaxID=1644056 RepID=UPI0006789DEC|nr:MULTISPECIES: hypothetical protein [Haloferax]REA03485.1 hypothetical protein DEQ92_10150 [Haloferax sp. Atlit-6N]REA03513.1 hypothetical protein DEQ92_10325 [Haloferax sp. Atlit-6N]
MAIQNSGQTRQIESVIAECTSQMGVRQSLELKKLAQHIESGNLDSVSLNSEVRNIQQTGSSMNINLTSYAAEWLELEKQQPLVVHTLADSIVITIPDGDCDV